jgi:hypothetical protein
MTADEAYAQIELLTQATTEPVLTNAELNLLVKKAKRKDSSNRVPTDSLWTPTWNIAMAVALGWETKAMKVATGYDIQSADQKLSRSQMFAQLMKVAQMWRKRGGESVRLKGDLAQNILFPSVNGPDDWWPWETEWADDWWGWANSPLPGQP